MKKLKDRWGITSNFQFALIFLVFAITGSVSAKIAMHATDFLGMEKEAMHPFLYWPIRIIMVFPIYQVLLLLFGGIFGQFRFFWNFEKKMLSKMGFKKYFQES